MARLRFLLRKLSDYGKDGLESTDREVPGYLGHLKYSPGARPLLGLSIVYSVNRIVLCGRQPCDQQRDEGQKLKILKVRKRIQENFVVNRIGNLLGMGVLWDNNNYRWFEV